MNKLELMHIICSKVIKERKIMKEEMHDRSKCGGKDFKCGLYFLYDANDQLIYIGQISNKDNTSLYHRMVGHGDGSHSKKDSRWYSKVAYGKFHQFKGLSQKQLNQIERLAISGMNQPIYNDGIDITQKAIDGIASKITQ